jgi:hypothetical protein
VGPREGLDFLDRNKCVATAGNQTMNPPTSSPSPGYYTVYATAAQICGDGGGGENGEIEEKHQFVKKKSCFVDFFF